MAVPNICSQKVLQKVKILLFIMCSRALRKNYFGKNDSSLYRKKFCKNFMAVLVAILMYIALASAVKILALVGVLGPLSHLRMCWYICSNCALWYFFLYMAVFCMN
jgi:hypothetical protein